MKTIKVLLLIKECLKIHQQETYPPNCQRKIKKTTTFIFTKSQDAFWQYSPQISYRSCENRENIRLFFSTRKKGGKCIHIGYLEVMFAKNLPPNPVVPNQGCTLSLIREYVRPITYTVKQVKRQLHILQLHWCEE
jgi:hypothetical protein